MTETDDDEVRSLAATRDLADLNEGLALLHAMAWGRREQILPDFCVNDQPPSHIWNGGRQ